MNEKNNFYKKEIITPEAINVLHKFYSQRREKNAPNIEELFEEGVIDRKIYDKEIELLNLYKASDTTPDHLKDLKKQIDILEGVVADQIDGGNWFGKNVECIATHELDDVFRHIDNVLEFSMEDNSQPKEYLGLGFDLVVHKEDSRLCDKLNRFIEEDIKKARLGEIKYYQGSEIAGELKTFRTVISLDGNTMRDLLRLRIAKNWDALKDHSFQADVIFQIILQVYSAYLYAENLEDETYKNSLQGLIIQINSLYNEKREFLESQKDRVGESNSYILMRSYLERELGIDI